MNLCQTKDIIYYSRTDGKSICLDCLKRFMCERYIYGSCKDYVYEPRSKLLKEEIK